jgi:hypothetical protein
MTPDRVSKRGVIPIDAGLTQGRDEAAYPAYETQLRSRFGYQTP